MKNLILIDLTKAEQAEKSRGIDQIEKAFLALQQLVNQLGEVEYVKAVIRPAYAGYMKAWKDELGAKLSSYEVAKNEKESALPEGLEYGLQWVSASIRDHRQAVIWVLSYNNRFMERIKDFSLDQQWREIRGHYHTRFVAKDFELRLANIFNLFRAAENRLGMAEIIDPNLDSKSARELHANSLTRRIEKELLRDHQLDLFPEARGAVFFTFRFWERQGGLMRGKTLFQHVANAVHRSRAYLSRNLGISPHKYHAFEATRGVVHQFIISNAVVDGNGEPISNLKAAMSRETVFLASDWESRILEELGRRILSTKEVRENGINAAEFSGLLFHSRGLPEARMQTSIILERIGRVIDPNSFADARFVLAEQQDNSSSIDANVESADPDSPEV